jgi:hypothetical protein
MAAPDDAACREMNVIVELDTELAEDILASPSRRV